MSTLDLLGPGWTLFTGPDRDAWDAVGSQPGAPLAVRALDAVTARTVGVRGDGAVLVRPDGLPVAVWSSSAGAAELRHAMAVPAPRSARDLAVA